MQTDRRGFLTLQQNITLTKRKLELQQQIVEAKERRQRLKEAAIRTKEKGGNEDEDPKISEDGLSNQNDKGEHQQTSKGQSDETDPPTRNQAVKKPNREQLLKRKKEAERKRAITNVKHLLSKQEYLITEQSRDAQKSKAKLEECQGDLSTLKIQMKQSRRSLQRLTARKKVLEELTAERVSTLVKKRKLLHDRKKSKSVHRSS
jgi:hypothetical protein